MPRKSLRIDPTKGEPLTPAEKRLVNALANTGKDNAELGLELNLTANTVHCYIYRICAKLDCTRSQIIVRVWKSRYKRILLDKEDKDGVRSQPSDVQKTNGSTIRESTYSSQCLEDSKNACLTQGGNMS